MSASCSEQIGRICEEMRALKNDVAALTRQTDLSAAYAIKDLVQRGDGVLAKLREPTGVQGKRSKKVSSTDSDDDVDPSDDDDDEGGNNEPSGALHEDVMGFRPTQEEEDDPSNQGKMGVSEALNFLTGLQEEIEARHKITAVAAPTSLRSHVKPFAHQLRAAALCLHAEHTPFKGMILADSPGLGKTLSILMTISLGYQAGDGPSVVVVPPSCCRQWMEEIRANFVEGTMSALFLNDYNISPFDLFRYRVIVTSYGQVVSEYRRLAKFEKDMEDYENGVPIVTPKRPKLTLLSGIWKMDGAQRIGRFLGLDEGHAVKNPSGRAYAAIKLLRASFINCLPISGTPLDNTWADIFSLLSLLRGHPFVSMLRMREIFTNAYEKSHKNGVHKCFPKTHWLLRLVRLLHAVLLSRPASIIGKDLPPCHEKVISFKLPKDELEMSNEAFAEYNKTLGANLDDAGYGVEKSSENLVKWSALVQAQQWTFHPQLVEIMGLERKVMKRSMAAEGSLDALQFTDEEQKFYDGWSQHLQQGENSRSARVDVIIDLVNMTRDRSPEDAILILDESVFFLDILEAAFTHVMYDPVQVFRYDGRQNPAERHLIMKEFSSGTGTRIMLATRGTGGQGLNMQCANVVIRCGPWWKRSWEQQALCRVYRAGQTKEVWLYELRADSCKVEAYKRRKRNKKNKTNAHIMDLLTMDDGLSPPTWIAR